MVLLIITETQCALRMRMGERSQQINYSEIMVISLLQTFPGKQELPLRDLASVFLCVILTMIIGPTCMHPMIFLQMTSFGSTTAMEPLLTGLPLFSGMKPTTEWVTM